MNAKRNALGKGLGALLENAGFNEKTGLPGADTPGAVSSLRIEQIDPNPFQPRDRFEETALSELADSIRQHGIIQPITVRNMANGRYQIISGERRWRASRMAGLDYIPAYTRIADDEGMLEMALVENIQRENLNPIEIALSFQRMVEELKLSVEDIASRAAKNRSTVVNYLRLLKLPTIIQAALREDKITMGHARAIIGVDKPDDQLAIFKHIMADNLSVRHVEGLVRKRKVRTAPAPSALSADYRTVRDRLADTYETKVELLARPNGSGKIIFNYYSTDDLNRLLDLLDA